MNGLTGIIVFFGFELRWGSCFAFVAGYNVADVWEQGGYLFEELLDVCSSFSTHLLEEHIVILC